LAAGLHTVRCWRIRTDRGQLGQVASRWVHRPRARPLPISTRYRARGRPHPDGPHDGRHPAGTRHVAPRGRGAAGASDRACLRQALPACAQPAQPGAASQPNRADRAGSSVVDSALAGARGKSANERTASIPAAMPNLGPTSQTFAPPASPGSGMRDGGPLRETPSEAEAGSAEAPGRGGLSIRDGVPVRGQRPATGDPSSAVLGGGVLTTTMALRREYHLPRWPCSRTSPRATAIARWTTPATPPSSRASSPASRSQRA